jgi:hypothetical protein
LTYKEPKLFLNAALRNVVSSYRQKALTAATKSIMRHLTVLLSDFLSGWPRSSINRGVWAADMAECEKHTDLIRVKRGFQFFETKPIKAWSHRRTSATEVRKYQPLVRI